MDKQTSGRGVLLWVGVGAVLVVGLFGYLVGVATAPRTSSFELFGLVTLSTSPAAMAGYAVTIAGVGLGVLYGAVELASRLEAQ